MSENKSKNNYTTDSSSKVQGTSGLNGQATTFSGFKIRVLPDAEVVQVDMAGLKESSLNATLIFVPKRKRHLERLLIGKMLGNRMKLSWLKKRSLTKQGQTLRFSANC